MRYTETTRPQIFKNEDGTYEVARPTWRQRWHSKDEVLWGVKTEDEKILIQPEYFERDEIEKAREEISKEYETVKDIASLPNWWVVKESRK